MNDTNLTATRSTALAVDPPANPDGKGVSGVMLDWHRSTPRGVVAKPPRQLLSELFTSLLVLSATFKSRPSVGAPRYLYWIDGDWSLSLIAPEEWSSERRAGFAGTCVLQPDMTWTIAPSQRLAEDNPVSDAVRRFYEGFVAMLDSDLTLEEILPAHSNAVPYFRRLHAGALTRSLRASLQLAGHASTGAREWRDLLPGVQNELLLQGA